MVRPPNRHDQLSPLSSTFQPLPLPPQENVIIIKHSSLKQKLDNSKLNQYLLELTMYITTIDPSTTP